MTRCLCVPLLGVLGAACTASPAPAATHLPETRGKSHLLSRPLLPLFSRHLFCSMFVFQEGPWRGQAASTGASSLIWKSQALCSSLRTLDRSLGFRLRDDKETNTKGGREQFWHRPRGNLCPNWHRHQKSRRVLRRVQHCNTLRINARGDLHSAPDNSGQMARHPPPPKKLRFSHLSSHSLEGI